MLPSANTASPTSLERWCAVTIVKRDCRMQSGSVGNRLARGVAQDVCAGFSQTGPSFTTPPIRSSHVTGRDEEPQTALGRVGLGN